MKVKLNYEYHEDNIIPPKCRKPRTIYGLKGESTVTIKETTIDQLDLVCRVFEKLTGWNEETKKYDGSVTDFYHYKGKLYRKTDKDLAYFENPRPYFYYKYSTTLQERRKDAREWAGEWLIVDGEVYKTSGEPRWVIHTFGLGGNHGGSSLSITNHYNSNIGKSRYFRLDQKEAANASFERIALGRGDTKSVPHSFEYNNAEVYRPDLLKVNPNKEHGNGDPFINGIENMISTVKDPAVSGVLLMAQTASILNK